MKWETTMFGLRQRHRGRGDHCSAHSISTDGTTTQKLSSPKTSSCQRANEQSSFRSKKKDVKDVIDGNDGVNGNVGGNCVVSSAPPTKRSVSIHPNRSKRIDHFLTNYCEFTSNTYTVDQALKLLQWSSWAASYLTQSNPSHPNAKLAKLSKGFYDLHDEFTCARYTLRFLGFFDALEGLRTGSWGRDCPYSISTDGECGKWDNISIDFISRYIMAFSMLFYYPLDNLTFLGWMMPNLIKGVDLEDYADICFSYAARFWGLYLVGEVWVGVLKLRELGGKIEILEKLLEMESLCGSDDGKGSKRRISIKQIQKFKTQLQIKAKQIKYQTCCFLLAIIPALNWSQLDWEDDPLLDEGLVNGLMLMEAILCLYTSIYVIGVEGN